MIDDAADIHYNEDTPDNYGTCIVLIVKITDQDIYFKLRGKIRGAKS